MNSKPYRWSREQVFKFLMGEVANYPRMVFEPFVNPLDAAAVIDYLSYLKLNSSSSDEFTDHNFRTERYVNFKRFDGKKNYKPNKARKPGYIVRKGYFGKPKTFSGQLLEKSRMKYLGKYKLV